MPLPPGFSESELFGATAYALPWGARGGMWLSGGVSKRA
jgi:glucokinase